MSLAILLDGPIGAGKSTLGRLLAGRLEAAFIDGDDHHVAGRSWYGSSLTTSRAILKAGLAGISVHDVVVVSYPMRCVNWVYYRTHFARAGARAIFVGLTASVDEIAEPGRGRSFANWEIIRTREMIAQGYGQRPFHHLRVHTGGRPVDASLNELETGVRRLAGP